MKPLRSIAITVFGCLALPLSAQETPLAAPVGVVAPPVLPSLAGTARILGKIPDGTPPPPAPPKPPFVVAPEHVRDTTAIQQGGRTITLQRIDPIALPPPPAPAAPHSAIDAAAFREKAAAYRSTHPWVEFLALGATVYRNGTDPARSFVRYRPNGGGEEIQFWSSADFSLLASLPAFTDGQGRSYSLFLMWTSIDPARTVARLAALGRTYVPPQIPDLPGGAATFTLIGPPPADARLLAPIRALHEIYTSQYAQLQSARADRERARLAREAELKAHPPQPQDLVIRHWRLGQGTPHPSAPTAPPPRRAAPPQPRRRPKRPTPPPAVRLSRRPLLAVLSLLAVGLLAPSARAILDANNDGMSDLWQTHFNAGNVLPENDDDHDGWTNAMEATAGTNPFDANPPAGIIRPAVIQTPAVYVSEGGMTTLETPAAVSVTWPTVAGKLYTLRCSSDMSPGSWLTVDLPRIGTGTGPPMGNAFTLDGDSPAQLFFTVAVEDVYSDSDIYSDAEEALLGTSPTDNDSDFDGVWDDVDPTPNDNNNTTDPDGHRMDPGINAGLVGWWGLQDTPTAPVPPTFPASSLFANRGTLAASHMLSLTGGSPSAFCIAGTGVTNNPTTATRTEMRVLTAGSALLGKQNLSINYWIQLPIDGLVAAAPGLPVGMGTTLMSYSNNGDALPVLEWRATRYSGQTRFSLAQIMGTAYNIVNPGDWDSTVKLDDGQWHHLALTVGSNSTRMFLDGAQVGPTVSCGLTIPNNAWQYNPYLFVGGYKRLPYPISPTLATYSDLKGRLDNIMVHNLVLPPAQVQAIYSRDRDNDTLADIVEVKSLLWRDATPYGATSANEYSYTSSPDIWQEADTDTDGDGLSTIMEISTTHTDPFRADTDGDLIPDGWEHHHGLAPNTAADAAIDNDSGGPDGLTNLDEFRHNTGPTNRDTDDDGTTDGEEANGPDNNPATDDGSDPTDATDSGVRRSATELVSFNLGVGDRSTSHSEDYVLNVFRIDPITGAEQRKYTLRSGGFGQYATTTRAFKKAETYTFQIQWIGSNHHGTTTGTIEGPDWDYHMVVEPIGTDTGGTLIDSYDPAKKTIATAPADRILDPGDISEASDDDDNVANFPNTLQQKRVVHTPVLFEFVDPDDLPWSAAMAPNKVVLDDKELRMKVTVKNFPSLSAASLESIGIHHLHLTTTATRPVIYTRMKLFGPSTTICNEGRSTAVRVKITRSGLIQADLVPLLNNDGAPDERSCLDHSSGGNSNFTDSEAFIAGTAQERQIYRGYARNEAGTSLDVAEYKSYPDLTFMQAAGAQVLTGSVEGMGLSGKALIMDQADIFYYSGHGITDVGGYTSPALIALDTDNGSTGRVLPAALSQYWGRDLECVVIAGCAVLNINNWVTYPVYVPPISGPGVGYWPGKIMETVGPPYLVGYGSSAPSDTQGTAAIAAAFLSGYETTHEPFEAWREANSNSNGRNAVAIQRGAQYAYFVRTEVLGIPKFTWTIKDKINDWDDY